jgi:hypothetical protein
MSEPTRPLLTGGLMNFGIKGMWQSSTNLV